MQQMISAMKDKNIVYNFSVRCNNIKGCFIGVQFKQETNVNYVRSPDDITTINKQQAEIEHLKKQLAELQSKFENNTPKKSKKNVTKKESKIEIEQTNMFSNEDLMDSFNESINDLM